MREVSVGERPVLLIRRGGIARATEARCTHEAGVLADGFLEGDRLRCPEHGATFDIRNGTVLVDPDGIEPPEGVASPLGVLPTKMEEGEIWVEIP